MYSGKYNKRVKYAKRKRSIIGRVRRGMRLTGNAYVKPIVQHHNKIDVEEVYRPSLRKGGKNALGRAVYDVYESLPSIRDIARGVYGIGSGAVDMYYSIPEEPRRYLTNAAGAGVMEYLYRRRPRAIMH